MQQRPDFQQAHEHKEAGMAETIVIGCQPLDVSTADVEVDWSDVPHPPTDDDGAYIMMHVIRFHDDDGAVNTPDHMEAYQQVAGLSRGAQRRPRRRLVLGRGHDPRRRSRLAPGAVQPVPEQARVHGGADRPRPARRPGRSPRNRHRRHLRARASGP